MISIAISDDIHCSHKFAVPTDMQSTLVITTLISRITACHEEKIWSLFKHINLILGNKILWIGGEIAQEQFLPFPKIF